MSALLVDCSVGSVLEFSYPTDNRVRVSTRLARRRFVVQSVRDLDLEPLDPITYVRRPELRRGPVLVTGHDLGKHAWRSFYLSSARSLKPVEVPITRLAFYDPTDESTAPKFFGPLWTDSRVDLQQIKHTIHDVNLMLDARRDVIIAVGLFPFPNPGPRTQIRKR